MKKFAFALIAASICLSTLAFAADKTVQGDLCLVKADGQYNGQIISGRRFFLLASAYSNRKNTCVIAKIANKASSSRIYFNGIRPISHSDGLTVKETDLALALVGLEESDCTVFSCEEVSL